MSELTWTPTRVKLGDLQPWERNPKRMSRAQATRLEASTGKLGRAGVLLVGPPDANGKRPLYDGHQRAKVWGALYGAATEVTALEADRALTDEERRATSLLTVTAAASFDWDALASWDVGELVSWGLDTDLLAQWNDDAANLREMIDAESDDDGNYSRKIEAPEYMPSDEKPGVADLFDDTKTRRLVDAIDAAEGITDDERAFLRIAAQRHTVLSFKKIADYYAHSDATMQALMEDSALVIIDFDKAISQGFVELTAKIAERVRDEYGDD